MVYSEIEVWNLKSPPKAYKSILNPDPSFTIGWDQYLSSVLNLKNK